MLYLGSLFGVRIGYMLSDVAIAVVLGVLLIYMEYKSFKKARRLWREETIQKELASKGLLPK